MTSESPIWALKKMKMDCTHIFFSKITDLGVSLKKEWATLASAAQRWHRAPRSAPLSSHTTAPLQSKASVPPPCCVAPGHGCLNAYGSCKQAESAPRLENGHCELHPAAQQSWGGGTASSSTVDEGEAEDLPGEWSRKGCTAKIWSAGHKTKYGSLGFGPGTSARSRRNVALQSSAHRGGLPEALTFPQQSSCCCPHPSPQAAQADHPPWVPWARQHCSQSTALQEHLQGHPSPIPRTDPTWSPSPAV